MEPVVIPRRTFKPPNDDPDCDATATEIEYLVIQLPAKEMTRLYMPPPRDHVNYLMLIDLLRSITLQPPQQQQEEEGDAPSRRLGAISLGRALLPVLSVFCPPPAEESIFISTNNGTIYSWVFLFLFFFSTSRVTLQRAYLFNFLFFAFVC